MYWNYFGGGRETVGYRSLAEGVGSIVQHVTNSGGETFTYLSVPRVDSLAHLHGIGRPEVRHALTEVDNEIGCLYTAIGSKARIVVTADHGFLDAPAHNRHTLRPTRELRPLLRFPPSGDARVVYLHTWEWARERVRRYFERRFEDRFIIVTIDEAAALGLFRSDRAVRRDRGAARRSHGGVCRTRHFGIQCCPRVRSDGAAQLPPLGTLP